MKINKKVSLLKKTIEELKNISQNLDNDKIYEKKINDLNREILRLRNGISESVDELEEFLEEKNAQS